MYINFDIVKEKGLMPTDVMILQLISQNRTDNLAHYIAMSIGDELLELLEKESLVEYIKGTKKQSEFEKIRLTSKGKKLLEAVQIPNTTEADIKMADYLMEMYLSHDDGDRRIGNKKKVITYCTIFRSRMQLSLHQMYWLCWYFLQEYAYTKVLQYIFYNDNKHRYSSFEAQFEESPLYQFLSENKKEVENIWKLKIT